MGFICKNLNRALVPFGLMICGGMAGWGDRAHSEWACSDQGWERSFGFGSLLPVCCLQEHRPPPLLLLIFVSFLGFLFSLALSLFFRSCGGGSDAQTSVGTFLFPANCWYSFVRICAARVGQFGCLSDFEESTTKETSLLRFPGYISVASGPCFVLLQLTEKWVKGIQEPRKLNFEFKQQRSGLQLPENL